MDFIAGIHDRREFGGLCQHGIVMGGVAYRHFFLREPLARPVLIGMSLALIGGIVSRIIRCVFMEQWNRLPVAESNPARTNVVWEFPGAHRRVDGGRIFDDRTQITREDVAHAVYLFGLWNGFGVFIDHRSGARESLFGYHWLTYVWILLLALVPQLIGHSTYNWALAYLSAAFVAVMTLGEPIGSSILAYFILQEAPTAAVIAGGVLILIGIYLSTRGSKIESEIEEAHD